MKNTNSLPGKILYALLFLVVIPVGLWFWAKSLDHLIDYPVIDNPQVGWGLIIVGGGLMLWGMFL